MVTKLVNTCCGQNNASLKNKAGLNFGCHLSLSVVRQRRFYRYSSTLSYGEKHDGKLVLQELYIEILYISLLIHNVYEMKISVYAQDRVTFADAIVSLNICIQCFVKKVGFEVNTTLEI